MIDKLKMLKTRTICVIKAGRKTCVEDSGSIWIQPRQGEEWAGLNLL